jgi:dipeptidyl-peptidase-4
VLRSRITEGPWLVGDLLNVDEANGWVYFTGLGREAGDPYLRRLYRVRLDGTDLRRLTPEDADHAVAMAPSGRWIVDTHSRIGVPPVTVLRAPDGRVAMTLEAADASRYAGLLGSIGPRSFTVAPRGDARSVRRSGRRRSTTTTTATWATTALPIRSPAYSNSRRGSRGST